jgi:predicted amidohydrolase
MTTELAVAVLQFAPGADENGNLAEIERLARRAAARGARLVVAPEYASYFRPEFDASWVAHAETLDGPFVAGLTRLAGDLGIHLVAGLSERVEGETTRFSNTLVAVGPTGLVAVYRKLHLYDAFGARESDWIVPGAIGDPVVLDVDGWRVGLETCYDVRFPEVTRRLVDAGAELVLIPAEWVRGPLKEHHWRTLVTARAIENTVFVAAADHAPPIGAGQSMVVDPMGVELVTIGENVEAAVAVITRDRLVEVRTRNPALALRRFGVVPRVSPS